MLLLRQLLLAATVLAIGVIAKAKENASDNLAKMASLTDKYRGVIPLDDKLFGELTSGPRDYTSAILLTALEPKYGCALCREFQPDYALIGKSWVNKNSGDDRNRLFFGVLDFGSGRATFQKLQLTTAPVLFLFSPTSGPNAKPEGHFTRYDFSPGSAAPAELIASWISRSTNLNIPVTRPFNYSKLITFIVGFLTLATFLKVAYPYVAPVVYNRNLWAAISLIMVLLFTSGHMFNHIRKVPYVANDGKGGVSYIAGGFSNQFGLETQIVALLYAILAFCTISLALKTPRIEDPRKQMTAIMVWNVIMLVLFSFLMNVFKIKNGSYPFFLPPFMT